MKKNLIKLVMFLGLSTNTAAASNLISNSNFNSNDQISGWRVEQTPLGIVEWNGEDTAPSRVDSGSMAITALGQPTNGNYTNMNSGFGCMPVTQNKLYKISARKLIPSEQFERKQDKYQAYTSVIVVWFNNSGPIICGNTVGASFHEFHSYELDSWELLRATLKAPPGAKSAMVILNVYKTGLVDEYQALFDNIYFGPVSK